MIVPVVALASMIEPTPIHYESGGACYNVQVISEIKNTDNSYSLTEIASSSEEAIFVEEPNANLPPEFYCVTYLRERLGVNIRGNAEDILPNITEPFVGAVVLMDFSGVAHAGLITYNLADRLIFKDSNFIAGTPRDSAMIMKDDPNIRGYYFKNPN